MMAEGNSGPPTADEYRPFYDTYIRRVPEGDIIAIIERQIGETTTSLAPFTPTQAQWRPAPGEWNALEIVGHMADTERIFAYRALSFGRSDPAPLPGMDPDRFMVGANFAERTMADIVDEFVAVRRATVALLRSLPAVAWARGGVADGSPITVRALAYCIAGHELYHAADFPRHRTMTTEMPG